MKHSLLKFALFVCLGFMSVLSLAQGDVTIISDNAIVNLNGTYSDTYIEQQLALGDVALNATGKIVVEDGVAIDWTSDFDFSLIASDSVVIHDARIFNNTSDTADLYIEGGLKVILDSTGQILARNSVIIKGGNALSPESSIGVLFDNSEVYSRKVTRIEGTGGTGSQSDGLIIINGGYIEGYDSLILIGHANGNGGAGTSRGLVVEGTELSTDWQEEGPIWLEGHGGSNLGTSRGVVLRNWTGSQFKTFSVSGEGGTASAQDGAVIIDGIDAAAIDSVVIEANQFQRDLNETDIVLEGGLNLSADLNTGKFVMSAGEITIGTDPSLWIGADVLEIKNMVSQNVYLNRTGQGANDAGLFNLDSAEILKVSDFKALIVRGSSVKMGNGTYPFDVDVFGSSVGFFEDVDLGNNDLQVSGQIDKDESVDSAIISASSVTLLGAQDVDAFDITFESDLNFPAFLYMELHGDQPGVNHHQYKVNGTVDITGSFIDHYNTTDGTTDFIVINNDGSDPVVGAGAWGAEGSLVTMNNGISYILTYVGGDGNDIAFLAPEVPTVAISYPGNTFINYAARQGFQIAGMTENVEDGQNVTVTLRDTSGNEAMGSVSVMADSFSFDYVNSNSIDPNSLNEGPIYVEVETSNLGGLTAMALDTIWKDTTGVQVIVLQDSINMFAGDTITLDTTIIDVWDNLTAQDEIIYEVVATNGSYHVGHKDSLNIALTQFTRGQVADGDIMIIDVLGDPRQVGLTLDPVDGFSNREESPNIQIYIIRWIAGDKNQDGTIDSTEIAGDLDTNGIIDGIEKVGDIDGNGVIDGLEILGDANASGGLTPDEFLDAGDANGNGTFEATEIAGDQNLNGVIDGFEKAGDLNGNTGIDFNDIGGDVNGDGQITGLEVRGDLNGNGVIDNGEIAIAGDINGSNYIDDNERAGDINGNGMIDSLEIAGDVNGSGSLDSIEVAGDLSGDFTIDALEFAGDVNGNRMFDSLEVRGDLNGNGVLDSNEVQLAGDINGNLLFALGEIPGDVNMNMVIDSLEIAGDLNGSGTIDSNEVAGDINGDRMITSKEVAGDVNGVNGIDGNDVAGDLNGNGVIDGNELGGDSNGDLLIGMGEKLGDLNDNNVIDSAEVLIVGDLNGSGFIGQNEVAGDIDGDRIVNGIELGGDINGDSLIVFPELLGDLNGNLMIDSNEVIIAGDVNGSGSIGTGEIVGDLDGNGIIDGSELGGDVDGDGSIGVGEVLGDLNGNGIIDNGEVVIAGDANGDGLLTAPELAGDQDNNGIIDGSELGGDVDGDGSIGVGEVLGDLNGNGVIDNGEVVIAGDTNGDGLLTAPELAGDQDNNGIIDGSELGGDVDGDGSIGVGEVLGDLNGNGIIDNGEVVIAGDANGDGMITAPELAGDQNNDGILVYPEIVGDLDGDGIIALPELTGDINGNSMIDSVEFLGDINGNGIQDYVDDGLTLRLELIGDGNGNFIIDGNELQGDVNGDGIVDENDKQVLVNVNEEIDLAFTVYPNPAEGNVQLSVPEGLTAKTVYLKNAQGLVVATYDLMGSGSINIELDQPSGVYVLLVETNAGIQTKKLVVK